LFTETPRWFGFPQQQYVRTSKGLKNILSEVNGTFPCFISVLTYPEPNIPIFDKLVFDFDYKHGLKKPYSDVSKLKAFCENINVPYTIIFSGQKGFHFYIHFLPSTITSIRLEAAHEGITNSLKFETVDRHLFGDLRRVMRMPTTVYINSKGQANGHYCRYLTKEDFEKGILHIKQISKTPGELPQKPKGTMLFQEFVEHIDNYWKHVFSATNNGTMQFNMNRTQSGIKTFFVIAPTCLRQHIGDINPKHIIRFETSCWLKLIGFDNISIYNFYEKLRWRDWDRQMTRYQVRRAKIRPPRCSKIRSIIGDKYCNECSLGGTYVINR